jgi:hypothetical protein
LGIGPAACGRIASYETLEFGDGAQIVGNNRPGGGQEGNHVHKEDLSGRKDHATVGLYVAALHEDNDAYVIDQHVSCRRRRRRRPRCRRPLSPRRPRPCPRPRCRCWVEWVPKQRLTETTQLLSMK